MRREDADGVSGRVDALPPGWSPRAVISILEPLALERRAERIKRVVEQRIGSVTLLLDAPHDPHNTSAVVRSCDAFGVQDLHVLPSEEFLVSSHIAKGSDRWVDLHEHSSPSVAIGALRAGGFQIVATHPDGDLEPADLARLSRVALVLGNEHAGIRPELSAAADHAVRIPMRGFVESLNLSVSAALLLFAATRGRHGDLSHEEQLEVYARGLVGSVPRADEVLAAARPTA